MSDGEIRKQLEAAVRPAFQEPFDPAADLARGRRRRRRNRAVGATAGCTALAAAIALAVPAMPFGSDGSGGLADGGGTVDTSDLTYVEDRSVIHDGDREIDVSPHEIMAAAKTDEGLVFVTSDKRDRTVYLTDGDGIEPIGRALWEGGMVTDDSGSYVAWVAPSLETVVYDTSRDTVVLRRPIGEGTADLPPSVVDLDGDVVYVRQNVGRDIGLAWDIEAGEPVRSNAALVDVSNGYLARMYWPPDSWFLTRVIVSPDPDSDQPRFRALEGPPAKGEIDLSPSGRYIASVRDSRPAIIDRATQQDVTPVLLDDSYVDYDLGYWIDDDRHVFQAYRRSDDPHSRPSELLVCSVSAGSCELAVESAGWSPIFPNMALV